MFLRSKYVLISGKLLNNEYLIDTEVLKVIWLGVYAIHNNNIKREKNTGQDSQIIIKQTRWKACCDFDI